MVSARVWRSAVVALFVLVGACNRDAATAKGLTGIWSWNPRAVLPREQIDDVAFPTPNLESYRFDADGHYVHVQRVPGYDTSVAGTIVHVPEEWREWKGTWSVADGRLTIKSGPESDWWVAKLRNGRWYVEDAPANDDRSYKIAEVPKSEARLVAIAIGDVDHTLHRAAAMPERPAVK